MKGRVSSIPQTAQEDETARERLERLTKADPTICSQLNAFTHYSVERCTELNSDGATWTCPDDTVGYPTADPSAESSAVIDGLFAELDD